MDTHYVGVGGAGEGGPRDLRRQKAWGNQRQAVGLNRGTGSKVGGLARPEGNSSLYPTVLRSHRKDLNHRGKVGTSQSPLELQLSKEEPRGAKRGGESPGRRCCRQWGCSSSWERKGVQDRVREQTGKADDARDEEGHGGEGVRQDNTTPWQAGGRQPWRTGAWCWLLPGAQLQAKQPTRARVPCLVHGSPKPKAALGRMAFLPEKQGWALRS